MGWTVQGSNSSGGEIFRTHPGCSIDYPPSSSAEVEERVELYLCSPSEPSWVVLGWTFLATCLLLIMTMKADSLLPLQRHSIRAFIVCWQCLWWQMRILTGFPRLILLHKQIEQWCDGHPWKSLLASPNCRHAAVLIQCWWSAAQFKFV
jgi:hypothetical protein